MPLSCRHCTWSATDLAWRGCAGGPPARTNASDRRLLGDPGGRYRRRPSGVSRYAYWSDRRIRGIASDNDIALEPQLRTEASVEILVAGTPGLRRDAGQLQQAGDGLGGDGQLGGGGHQLGRHLGLVGEGGGSDAVAAAAQQVSDRPSGDRFVNNPSGSFTPKVRCLNVEKGPSGDSACGDLLDGANQGHSAQRTADRPVVHLMSVDLMRCYTVCGAEDARWLSPSPAEARLEGTT